MVGLATRIGPTIKLIHRRICSRVMPDVASSAISTLDSEEPLSAVEKGLALERAAIKVLSRFHFQLRHVGGANDRGVDLRGTWPLPSARSSPPSQQLSPPSLIPPINVIIQCKNEATCIGPKVIRELEGTLTKETGLTLGLLVTSNGLSRRALDAIQAATLPIGFATIDNIYNPTLVELQFNHVAQRTILSDIVIAPRYVKAENGAWTRQVVIR
ncbi:hypothetical protein SeMB42_g03060 [Synchytrium endobioticum]|uniref:Restriction endonuclease type IV Mrr domain-containing protein n=1 Tax=Synchytrium endobioticum TaxID=286115 RepID=A0A507D9R1_9FUNG|nr:hypothetical protein SeMB42_g03060 [Synchytrium endobioticum]TPX50470.1 hypothetical protein SeLEV6574_g00871 [Synchytrium endobioticum]